MIRTNDPNQLSFIDPLADFGPKRRKKLENSWAHFFRYHVLPEFPVERIYSHFSGFGRPSKELYSSLGLLVLQQTFDIGDAEALSQLAFNSQWHYALNIVDKKDDFTYMCEKTLYNTRNILIKNDLWNTVFESVTDSFLKLFQVDTDKQRLDSTHIQSNMKSLGRIGILSNTLHRFLVNLKRQHRPLFDSLSTELTDRYLKKKQLSAFSQIKPSESSKTLKSVAKDLYYLITSFESHQEVQNMKSFALVQRVFNEQCELKETNGFQDHLLEVEPKPAKQVKSDSLQNPSDPDASYDGHKGKGYQVQIMETCSEVKSEDKPNLITHVAVEPAHCHDSKALDPALQATEYRGVKPKELLADSLYGSDENTLNAKQQGVHLVSPTLMAATKTDKLHLDAFLFNGKGRIKQCPSGKSPLSQQVKQDIVIAKFEKEQCRICPKRDQCPVKDQKKTTAIRYSHKDVRLALRRNYEKTPEFTQKYALRAGVEATMSEYKRITGVGKLRVRGLKSVSFCATMKALGVNILRSSKAYFATGNDRIAPLSARVCNLFADLVLLFWILSQKVRNKMKTFRQSIGISASNRNYGLCYKSGSELCF
jgi:IS5 family transposase